MEPPAHLKALLDAYVEVTALPVTLSYQRALVLTELHDRGITPDDVWAVLTRIKRHISAGTGGFTDSSLDFRNALGNPDTFEERALKLRQEQLRKKGIRRAPDVAKTRTLPDGSTTTVLVPTPRSKEPITTREALGDFVKSFAQSLGRQ
jgi:hypothetical protein